MIRTNLVIVARNIVRHKVHSFVNIVGLSIGIALSILIFLWIYDETHYDNYHPNKNRIFLVSPKGLQDSKGGSYSPYALPKRIAEKFPEVENYSRIENHSFYKTCVLSYQSNGKNIKAFYENNFNLADSSFFSIFGYPFIYGDPETAFKDKYSIVLSEKTSEKFFGNENPVGKILIFNNSKNYTVTGVVKVPSNSFIQFDEIVPINSVRDVSYTDGWDSNGPAVLLLKKNTNPEAFQNKLSNSLKEILLDNYELADINLVPLTSAHLYWGLNIIVKLFSAIALFILLIACINYVNLTTALSSYRIKEVGIKKTVGASKFQMIRQFLFEAVILSFISMNFAMLLVKLTLPLFNEYTSKHLDLILNSHAYLSVLLIASFSLFIGLLAGSYPAFIQSSFKPLSLLNRGNNLFNSKNIFRKVLVTFQFFMSVTLIICSAFIYKQFNYLNNMPLGFDKENVIKIPINKEVLKNYSSFKQELLKNPEILDVTAASTVPFAIGNHSSVRWGAKSDDELEKSFKFAIVNTDYIKTFGMSLMSGKTFEDNDPNGLNGYIINEAAVKRMHLNNPLGEIINFWGKDGEIIGVVKDFENNFLVREIKPMILSANPKNYFFLKSVFVKIAPGTTQKSINYIETISKNIAPGYPFEYEFVAYEFDDLLKSMKQYNKILITFTAFIILVSLMGLYGMTLFASEKRIKEIGLRKVNGASTIQIMVLLSKSFISWVVLACILSFPVAYFVVEKMLRNFDNRTNISSWLFLLTYIFVLIIVQITISWQTWLVARKNPVESLRYE